MSNNKHAILVLFVILFLVMAGFGIVIPNIPYFIEALGGNSTVMGFFMASYSIMQFIFAPLWGRMSDRIGRRPVLLIGLGGYAVTFFLFGFVSSLWMLFAIRILAGMISSATLPTAMAYIADITEEGERSKGMGMMGAAMGLGMILGPALGGLLGHQNFSLPFFAAGGLAFLAWPFAWAWLPESNQSQSSGLGAKTRSIIPAALFRHALRNLFVLAFALNFTLAMFEASFAFFIADRGGYGPREMGILFAVMGLCGAIVQGGLLGRLAKRFGDSRMVIAGLVITGAGLLLLLSAHRLPGLLVTSAIFNVGASLVGPGINSLASLHNEHGQGVVQGMMQSASSLGRIIGPVAGGLLYAFNSNLPYITGAAILGVYLAGFGRRLEPKTVRPDEI